MNKLTRLLAAVCTLPFLTGCGTESGTPQDTTATTASQSATASAVQTTVSTSATTIQTETAATTGTEISTGTTAKTTTGTTVSTNAGDRMLTVTLEGHIAVLVDDVITEYGEKTCENEGYVVCRCYQGDPLVLRLPLETCQKLEKNKAFTFVFPATEVTDRLSSFYFYADTGRVCADYSNMLTLYGTKAEIREAQNGEYGLDCNETVCVGMATGDMPQNESGTAAKRTGSFTAEVIRAYAAPSFEAASSDYVLLLRDGEPEILEAKEGVSKNLTEGTEYRFSFNKEGKLVK